MTGEALDAKVRLPARPRVGLVGCVKAKSTHSAPAVDLYQSALFRGRVQYVVGSCDQWFILSALHGVVEPDQILEPYDVALDDASRQQRREWSRRVLLQLLGRLGELGQYEFEFHAGAPYRDFGLVDGLEGSGALVTNPTAGLRIGHQLAFYAKGMS